MAYDFTIKQNDTGVALDVTCYPVRKADVVVGTTVPVDITGATGVTFTMRKGPQVVIDQQPGSIVDAAVGRVKYDWTAANTATAGKYHGWFTVTFFDGTKVSFPNDDDQLSIEIAK